MKMVECLSRATPVQEKLLATLGAAVGGSLTLGHINAAVGVLVGLLTVLMLIPRVVIAWREMLRHRPDADDDDPVA